MSIELPKSGGATGAPQGGGAQPPVPPAPPQSPNAVRPPTPEKPRRNNTWIYATIIALLAGTNIYLFMNRREVQSENESLALGKASADSSYDAVNREYQAALGRLDQLVSDNQEMDSVINGQSSEITRLRGQIDDLLNKERRTAADYAKAQRLIKQLNNRVRGYEQRVAELEGQNKTLSEQAAILAQERDVVVEERETLRETVRVGQVLHASNIRMVPIDLRRGGTKERETSKARRVDVMRILFDIDENRIAESGLKDVFLRITDPGGAVVSNAALGSGVTTGADGQSISYTLQKGIDLRQGERVADVAVDWRQDGEADYERGTYGIEIFNEGYRIGSGSVTLR